ncbi:MAG: hypothetical protein ACK56I_02390, partial [bacterium]
MNQIHRLPVTQSSDGPHSIFAECADVERLFPDPSEIEQISEIVLIREHDLEWTDVRRDRKSQMQMIEHRGGPAQTVPLGP